MKRIALILILAGMAHAQTVVTNDPIPQTTRTPISEQGEAKGNIHDDAENAARGQAVSAANLNCAGDDVTLEDVNFKSRCFSHSDGSYACFATVYATCVRTTMKWSVTVEPDPNVGPSGPTVDVDSSAPTVVNVTPDPNVGPPDPSTSPSTTPTLVDPATGSPIN
jgi:hypothetical protein